MHDKLFSEEAARERDVLERYAREIGLDVEDFKAALDDGRFRDRIAQDQQQLLELRMGQPPVFIVNGRRADGPVALVQLVEAALRRAGRKVPPPPPPAPVGVMGPAGPPGGPLGGPLPDERRIAMFLSPAQRFHQEARDEAWAAAVEKQLGPLVAADLRALDPEVAAIKLECRTRQCRLRWRPATNAGGTITSAFVRRVYAAQTAAPPAPGAAAAVGTGAGLAPAPRRPVPEATEYLELRPDSPAPLARRDLAPSQPPGQPPSAAPPAPADESIARFKSRRSGIIYGFRTGRRTPDKDLPIERLPRE
jgi:hypothetical protein